MTKLPNNLEVEERTYAASEAVQLVLRATAAELAACINLLNALRGKGGIELSDAVAALRERSQELGIPQMVDERLVTAPLDVGSPRSS